MSDYKVYEKVWVMEHNKPTEKLVFAVVESMGYYKNPTQTETHYQLVDSCCGAGWGNNSGIRKSADDMFKAKEDLINSL